MTADTPKHYIPGLAGLDRTLMPYGYPVVRFGAGAALLYHGYGKLFLGNAPMVGQHVLAAMGFPAPVALAYFIGILEFFGGIMLALGLFTRLIALMLSVEFVFVVAWHAKNGYGFSSPGGGYEYPLLLLVLYVGILLRGGDRCALDRLIGREF